MLLKHVKVLFCDYGNERIMELNDLDKLAVYEERRYSLPDIHPNLSIVHGICLPYRARASPAQ